MPLIIAVTLAGGILIGAKMFPGKTSGNPENVALNVRRFQEVMSLVDREYVDSVNVNELTEYSISQMLDRLDPHSVYIPAKEVQAANEPLEGNFDGVGIEFLILKDTIDVVTALSGGPSEAVGVRSGDKIVTVDGIKVAGIGITNKDVMKKLRGPKGTKVHVGIRRRGERKDLDFTITRDKIPTHSVEVAFMVDKQTGFIRVSRFSATTYDEFKAALDKLQAAGMKRMVLDLRDNPGGYMDKAVRMADEFLPANRMIVYTKSKNGRYDQSHRSTVNGNFEHGPVIVLINEGSASASEIVSGALQDNDRALIVGRRSFGKGLVQLPKPLSDGSELRLTISRYYTPTGRSIQKPYIKGDADYDRDYETRYEHGEFFHADSIHFNDSLKYKTVNGRTVYGGGGIMPDIFVGLDTSQSTRYYAQLLNKNVLREYALEYSNSNRAELEKMGLEKYSKSFSLSPEMLKQITDAAVKAGVPNNEVQFKRSEKAINNTIKAFIARGVWREEGFYSVYSQNDDVLQQAMKLWDKAAKVEKGAKN